MRKKYLDDVYDIETPDDTQALYAAWSESYDDETAENGYASPERCAAALGRFADPTLPVLDLGCGTGVSGAALRMAGFSVIDGLDFSEPMLAQARQKGIYRALVQTDLADPLPFEAGTYPAIAAVGVFSPAHAGPETIDAVMGKLPRGGHFVFTLNDHALQTPGYEGRVKEHVDCGAAQMLFREHGAHLPNIGLQSLVYVLRKA